MGGTTDGQRLRLVASGIAAAAVLAFALVSATNLISAWGLQHALDHDYRLGTLNREWSQALLDLPERELRRRAEQAVGESGSGLRFIALSDLGGVALASAGQFEHTQLGWLPRGWRQELRSLLYRLSSQTGRMPLTHQGRPVGSLDYALSLSLPQQVHDEAVSRLARTGWIGLLAALASGSALLWLYRRSPSTPERQLSQRLQTPARREPSPGRSPNSPSEPLSLLGLATLDCDAEGRVLRLSARAEALTGWTQSDAQGLPVGSVFHLHDAQGLPQPVLAATALRTREATPAERGQLRARNGQFTPIEAQAAPTEQGATLLFRDTRREADEREALAREARLSQGVIDHLDEGLITTDPAGVVRSANARALRMFGYAPGELAGVTVTKLLPVPFLNTPGVKLTDYIAAKDARRLPRVVGWRKDATTFQAELEVQPLTAGEDSGLIVILRDITERLRGENLALRLGRLLDSALEEIYIFDAQSLYFLEVNRGAQKNLGYSAAELTRLTPLAISTDLGQDEFNAHLARLRGGEAEALSYRSTHRRADGSSYPVEVRLNFSRDEEPPVFMAIAADITERAKSEAQLRHLAQHDALTGLPNRAVLYDRLAQLLPQALRGGRQLAVLFMDLDRFKTINDTYGHETGDRVLKAVAERLRGLVRGADTVARLAGDEFVIVAQGMRGADDAAQFARKVLDAFSGELDIPGQPLRVTPSIGVSLFPSDDTDAEGLLRHADTAMYEAKRNGRNTFCLFDAQLDPARRRLLDLDREVQSALALNQFHLLLAPVRDVQDQLAAAMLGFYWEHPRHGRVEADETLRAAARSGMLAGLELWLIGRALTHYHLAMQRGLPPVALVLPISGWQLRDADFHTQIAAALTRFEVPPPALMLSLSPDGLNDARSAAPDLLQHAAQLGVRYVLRDYAEGFAGLNRDTPVPISAVLLSPDLVARSSQGGEDARRVQQIAQTAAALRWPLIAPQVDDSTARERLHGLGCTHCAGSVFGAPQRTRAAAEILARAAIRSL